MNRTNTQANYALFVLLPLIVCPLAAGLVWQGMRGYREAVTPT